MKFLMQLVTILNGLNVNLKTNQLCRNTDYQARHRQNGNVQRNTTCRGGGLRQGAGGGGG